MLRAPEPHITDEHAGEGAGFAAVQRRTVRVLIAAQLLGALGLAAGGTAGSLLAAQITGNEAAAGLPLSMLVLGSGVAAVAVTRIMERTGRRTGLATAHLSGALGAGVVVAAAALPSWPMLLLGCGLLGGGNAAVMLARYAAADLSSRSGRSISAVVTAASAGAVVGPNLLGAAGSLARTLNLPGPAGLFLLAIPAFAGAAVVLLVFLRPDPLQVARAATAAPARSGGSLAALLGDSHIRFALLVLGVANLAMVGVMAVGPVHMHVHGTGLGLVGLVISAHIAAMFLPSPLTGWLSDTFGGRAVAALGASLLVGAGVVAALAGSDLPGIVAALLMLGVGWNAGLIGGSTLLRDAQVDPALRTRAEGLGELGMGAAAALGGSGAGLLLAAGDFGLVGLAAAMPCLLLLAVVAATGQRGHRGHRDHRDHLGPPARPARPARTVLHKESS
jgi:MFS family permease